jgi:hypothetical protein
MKKCGGLLVVQKLGTLNRIFSLFLATSAFKSIPCCALLPEAIPGAASKATTAVPLQQH